MRTPIKGSADVRVAQSAAGALTLGAAAVLVIDDGHECLVDAQDYGLVQGYTWRIRRSASGVLYANTSLPRNGGNSPTLAMHQLILGVRAPIRVDHIDGDGLNNQRGNLRIVTASQNGQNRRGAPRHSTTGVRGVTFDKERGCYRARVKLEGREVWQGRFPTLAEAAEAVSKARAQYMTHSPECVG